MPLQNRVLPDGDIVAVVARGTLMGNRGGVLHTGDRVLARRRWASRQWICCRLAFKGRRRQVMSPGRYTELFFLDEATAFAAGHRPCFECRRYDADRFARAWNAAQGLAGRARAFDIDCALHAERVDGSGGKRTTLAQIAALPDSAIIRTGRGAELVQAGLLWQWSPAGYRSPRPAPAALVVEVLTPPSILAVLAAGYRALLHDTVPGRE